MTKFSLRDLIAPPRMLHPRFPSDTAKDQGQIAFPKMSSSSVRSDSMSQAATMVAGPSGSASQATPTPNTSVKPKRGLKHSLSMLIRPRPSV